MLVLIRLSLRYVAVESCRDQASVLSSGAQFNLESTSANLLPSTRMTLLDSVDSVAVWA